MQTPVKIFFSWSGRESKIAVDHIKTLLDSTYNSNSSTDIVKIFVCEDRENGTLAIPEIMKNLPNSDLYVFFLTNQNIGSSWLIFEYGYTRSLSPPRTTIFININRTKEHEKHIKELVPKISDLNKEALILLYSKINNIINLQEQNYHLLRYINNAEESIRKIYDELINLKKQEKVVRKYGLGNLFKTKSLVIRQETAQNIASDLQNSLTLKNKHLKIIDIPLQLREYLYTRAPDLKHSNQVVEFDANGDLYTIIKNNPHKIDSKLLKLHTIWISQHLRVSTFIGIYDEFNVVLFGRREINKNSPAQQEVINQNLDCFGAVHFENASLFIKLKLESLDAEIEKISNLDLLAFEDIEVFEQDANNNLSKKPIHEYTCIMFGFAIKVSSDSMQNIRHHERLTSEVQIMSHQDFLELTESSLSSKALSFQHFIRNINSK